MSRPSVAFTYSRGRTIGAAAETGTLTREAGQFTNYQSCPVRSGQGVSLEVPAGFSSAAGGVVIYFDPDYAHNSGSAPGTGQIFTYYLSGTSMIRVGYLKASAFWFLQIIDPSSGGAYVTLSDTWAAGAPKMIYAAWNGTHAYLATEAAAASASRTYNAWASEPAAVWVGSSQVPADQFLAAYGAAALLSGPITTAQRAWLARLADERPPAYGEACSEAMLSLWYGEGTRVLSCADAIDLAAHPYVLSALDMGGIPPMTTRMVNPPLRQGAVYIESVALARPLVSTIVITGTSWQDFADSRRRLAQALNPLRGEGILTRSDGTWLYEADAVVQAGLGMPLRGGRKFLTADVQWFVDDPGWRAVVLEEDDLSPGGEGSDFPTDFPTDFLTGPTFTITNPGDLPVYPVFTIEGPVVGPYVENTTTGKVFRLSAELTAGQVLTIDMDARTVLRDDGTNLYPTRVAGSEMWAIEPGENVIEAGFTTAAIRPVTVTMQYAPRYVGV